MANSPSTPTAKLRVNFAFKMAQKNDARRAYRFLQEAGLDWSLEHCARAAAAMAGRNPGPAREIALTDLMAEFEQAAERRGLREDSLRLYRHDLEKFAAEFPRRTAGAITRQDIKRHVEGMEAAPGTALARWRAIRAMFRWALAQEPPLVASDPTAGLKFDLGRQPRPHQFLPVEACRKILRHAGEYRHAAAILLFAGLRPSEVAPIHGQPALRWEVVDRREKFIVVPARVAKTGRDRAVRHSFPILWDWLVDAPKTGPVCPHAMPSLLRALQLAGGYADYDAARGKYRRKLVKPWPYDATRRTFATYHVALYGNPGWTSLDLGHRGSLNLLYSTYMSAGAKSQAEKFAEIGLG